EAGQLPLTYRKHAQSLTPQTADLYTQLEARFFRKLYLGVFATPLGAQRQDDFRCTLDANQLPRANAGRRVVIRASPNVHEAFALSQRRVIAAPRFVRKLRDALVTSHAVTRVESNAFSAEEQCFVRRVVFCK